MASTPIPAPARGGRRAGGSRRLLALAGDQRLGDLVRAGNEAAFEVAFERHGPPILSFCRQILGSHEEAEDAVQQTFASAHRALVGSERPVELKPWLFTIARNRCLSILRARRADPVRLEDHPVPGLTEEVERRAELRELVRDLADLPEQQRSALVLFELGDLSHEQIGEVIGCEALQVKGIVFRARAGLAERRESRHAPCEEIREELATLRGGSLRRNRLRHHLRECPSCAAFQGEVRRQRTQMAILLPVVPSAGLKAAVLGTAGSGGGLGGLLGSGVAGSAGLAKLALVGVVAGGVGGAGIAIDQRREAGADRERAAQS
ncbi:MAG: sigma-70 family RNA polymerase sigma factor, partial [Actinomycetota bacterium]|nr:sigma-70 family RNA polymerase sigma factor [Actinomycetota bacterium]